MSERIWRTGICTAATVLATAAPALGADDGEGLAGETDDKVITFFSLGVILFFLLVIVLGTFVQTRLENRKYAREAARKRARSAGW